MRYLAIDPRWSGGTPPADVLQRFDGVRFVVFPDSWQHVTYYLEIGMNVDLVVARESLTDANGVFDLQHMRWYADWCTADWFRDRVRWIVGNEPDNVGPSSWTMTPTEYYWLWFYAATYLHGERWIAGMCSGDVAKAKKYMQRDATGLMVHLYTLTPEQAEAKMREYMFMSQKPTRVGEFHEISGYSPEDYFARFDQFCWSTYFCYSDDMVLGMGLPHAA